MGNISKQNTHKDLNEYQLICFKKIKTNFKFRRTLLYQKLSEKSFSNNALLKVT